MKVKKQKLELDREQHTGSKLGREYVKAVYCHPAGVHPRQDPGGTLGMNGIGERERREPSLDRAKSVRERERERESDQTGGAAGSGNALFITVVFIS